jgi:hypothetical protein
MFGDLKLWPRWNHEVLHAFGVQFHLQNCKFKTPTKKLAPWAKTAKFRCLVIRNWGPGGIMSSPARWGSNSAFKTLNSKHPPNVFALWNKVQNPMFSDLKLSTNLNRLKSCSILLNVAILAQNNWTYKKKAKKNNVNWNFNIHVIYFLCSCKHQVAYEEYKLKIFALNNLIFTSYNFWEPYPRWEKKRRERNESLWALYTSSYATWTYVACYVMWHAPHNMFQNKIWGGKIATSNAKSATWRMSAGLAGPGQGGPWPCPGLPRQAANSRRERGGCKC